jgi:hypothetical protein
MNLMRWRPLFAGLFVWIGLGVAASCSSDDQAPGGGRLEHPVAGGPTKAPPSSTSLAPSQAPVVSSAPSIDHSPSISQIYEKNTGLKLSPRDKAILDDCPDRAWSKNVPQRQCTRDDECGDGFCDRDHCAPLWTCRAEYSRPCERDDHCAVRPCIDGRCRSCISDLECKRLDLQDAKCNPAPWVSGARECDGVEGSRERPPAPRPKQ